MSEDARNMFVKMLMKKYGHAIKKIVREILHDPDVVEDIYQEVLLSCALRQETLERIKEDEMMIYIWTITKNACYNEARQRENIQKREDLWYETYYKPMTVDEIDFTEEDNAFVFSEKIEKLLKQIKPMDREILVLKFHMGYSNEEIANILGTTVMNIKKRFQRTKAHLVSLLTEGGDEDETV